MTPWMIAQQAFQSILTRLPSGQLISRAIFLLFLTALTFVTKPLVGNAQEIEVEVSIVSVSSPRALVSGRRESPTRVWSFRNAYASMLGLGERIENLKLSDVSGKEVPVRKLASGEYESSRDATRWSCEIILNPPAIAGDAAYVSWIAGDRGFLMLGDLLPLNTERKSASLQLTRVRLNLPASWTASTTESKQTDGQFEVRNTGDAVFFVGKNLRERRDRIGGTECVFVTEGEWAFSDQDVMTMAVRIQREYLSRTGVAPVSRVALMLSHFPMAVGAERWSAETRGETVTLLSGQSPSKIAGLAQLSTPLTHELFHLWVPNGLSLTGNYDWFYEGFTLYEALCVSLRLEFLTFQDYLSALGRAFDAYISIGEGRKVSLVDASQRRWTGTPKLIYQRGLLVAFLYDLKLRHISKGKHSLEDVYREIFNQSRGRGMTQDANKTILSALKRHEAMKGFVESFVEGNGEIELKSMIAPFGLSVQNVGNRTQILPSGKIDRRQRDLLGAFGYNDQTRRVGKRDL